MPRKPQVHYNATRKAYICQIAGKQYTLRAAEKDDQPNGPDYKAAIRRYAELVCTNGVPSADQGSQPLVAVLDARLAWLRDNRSQRTFNAHTFFLGKFSKWFGLRTVGELTPLDVDRYIAGQSRWNETTRSIFLGMLSSALNWAVKKRLLPSNTVTSGAEKYLARTRTKNALMPLPVHESIMAFLAERKSHEFSRLLRFWRLTGCRPFEATVLLVSDFQPDSKRCVIPYERMPRSKRRKNRVKDRVIYLGDEAFQLVQECCANKPITEHIFKAPRGKPWNNKRIDCTWAWIRRGLKLPVGIMPYSYRHSWITSAITSGIPPAMVAEFCGTSIAMIDKTYGHLDARPEKLREILALIELK